MRVELPVPAGDFLRPTPSPITGFSCFGPNRLGSRPLVEEAVLAYRLAAVEEAEDTSSSMVGNPMTQPSVHGLRHLRGR